MDDTPDKLRRNVVILAAAILAISLSDLSFRTNGTLLGFTEVSNVNAFRVWLALTATLVYMFLRWRYAVDTEKKLLDIKVLFDGLRARAIKERIASQVCARLMDGRSVTVLEEPDGWLDNGLTDRLLWRGRPTYVHPDIGLRKFEAEPSLAGATGIARLIQWPDGQHYGCSGANMLTSSPDGHSRAVVLIASVWLAGPASAWLTPCRWCCRRSRWRSACSNRHSFSPSRTV